MEFDAGQGYLSAARDPPASTGEAPYLECDTYFCHPEVLVTRDQMAVYIRRDFGLWMPE